MLLPNQVQAVAGTHRVIDFAWVSGLGAVVAIAANPLAGALSDRTISRFGRRRPWALGGAVATAAALCLVGRLHSMPEIAAGWCLAQVYTVAVAVTTVIAGRRSDRTGRRRRSVALGGGLMAAATALVAARPDWPVLLAAAPVLGIGFGMYLSIDQALVTQVLPSAAERATSLGMISVASSAGQAVAPALATLVVTYLGLYLCAAAVVLLGSASVWRIRSVT